MTARAVAVLALVAALGVAVVLATSSDAGRPTALRDVAGAPAPSEETTRPAALTGSEEAPPGDSRAVPDDARAATVASITDGDTLRVEAEDGTEPVRLLQIDTPETSGDCGAAEATAALERLAPVGSTIWLQADVEDRDRYDRLLRYLWRDDGTMINVELVRRGWARAVLYEPNDRHWERMRRAEQQARDQEVGLWALCGWTAEAAANPSATVPPSLVTIVVHDTR